MGIYGPDTLSSVGKPFNTGNQIDTQSVSCHTHTGSPKSLLCDQGHHSLGNWHSILVLRYNYSCMWMTISWDKISKRTEYQHVHMDTHYAKVVRSCVGFAQAQHNYNPKPGVILQHVHHLCVYVAQHVTYNCSGYLPSMVCMYTLHYLDEWSHANFVYVYNHLERITRTKLPYLYMFRALDLHGTYYKVHGCVHVHACMSVFLAPDTQTVMRYQFNYTLQGSHVQCM